MLEEQEDAVVGAALRRLAEALDQPLPALGVRRLERVVVALDPRPDDEVRADRAGEVRSGDGPPARLLPGRRIGRGQRAAAEARVEVEPAGDGVDVVPAERFSDLVEVRLVELAGVVELVAVDQVAEAVDGAPHPLDRRLAGPLGLVAGRHEPGHHRPEGPDPEARLQRERTSSRSPLSAERRIASTTSSQR